MLRPKIASAAPTAPTYCQYELRANPTTSMTTATTSRADSGVPLTRFRPNITAPPPDHDEHDHHERDGIGVPPDARRLNDRLQHADEDTTDRGDDHVAHEPEQRGAEREDHEIRQGGKRRGARGQHYHDRDRGDGTGEGPDRHGQRAHPDAEQPGGDRAFGHRAQLRAQVRPAQEDLDADGQQDRGRDLDQAADGYAGPEYLHARAREQIGKVVRGAVQDPVAHRDDADRDGDRHRGAHLDARLEEVADHQQAQDHPDQRAAYDGHHRGGPGRQPEPSHAEQAHAGSEGPHGAKGQVDHAEHLVHQDDAHGERGVDSAGHQPG